MIRKEQMLLGLIASGFLLSGCSKSDLYVAASNEYTVSTAMNAEQMLNSSYDGQNLPSYSENDGSTLNGIPVSLIEQLDYADTVVSNDATVHYLNVGGSMCCFIADNSHIVIVGTGSAEYEEKFFFYLQKLAPSSIDLVITNMNEAYAGNTVALIEKYGSILNHIIVPPYNSAAEDIGNSIMSAVMKKGLKVSVPDTGKKYELSGVTAVTYRPYSESPTSHSSAETVFSLYANGGQYVFEGNLGMSAEQGLIKYYNFDFDTPTHSLSLNGSGDKSHASSDWLSTLSPQYVVVPTRDVISDDVLQRLSGVNFSTIYLNQWGTTLLRYSDGFINAIGNIVDYDANTAYTEPTPFVPSFEDFTVVVDDKLMHMGANCSNFDGTNISKMLASKAIDAGYSICVFCLPSTLASDYYTWKQYQPEETSSENTAAVSEE